MGEGRKEQRVSEKLVHHKYMLCRNVWSYECSVNTAAVLLCVYLSEGRGLVIFQIKLNEQFLMFFPVFPDADQCCRLYWNVIKSICQAAFDIFNNFLCVFAGKLIGKTKIANPEGRMNVW
jgi:hypothetical protein